MPAATLLAQIPDLMAAVASGTVDVLTEAVPLAEVERAWAGRPPHGADPVALR